MGLLALFGQSGLNKRVELFLQMDELVYVDVAFALLLAQRDRCGRRSADDGLHKRGRFTTYEGCYRTNIPTLRGWGIVQDRSDNGKEAWPFGLVHLQI